MEASAAHHTPTIQDIMETTTPRITKGTMETLTQTGPLTKEATCSITSQMHLAAETIAQFQWT